MGEYATIQGSRVKLGTMDDWRYIRHDEAERWKYQTPLSDPENLTISEALQDATILWRFPFPWEDGNNYPDKLGDREMHKPSIVVKFPASVGANITHERKAIAFNHGGAFNVNVYVPCPYVLGNQAGGGTDLEVKRCSQVPSEFYAAIEGERYGGERGQRTIFRCIYCEAIFCLSWAELPLGEVVTGDPTLAEKIKARFSGPEEGTI